MSSSRFSPKFSQFLNTLSFNFLPVNTLRKMVSKLSQRIYKVDREFLKSLGIYCTKSALNKRELIKVIRWFVVTAFIQNGWFKCDWNITDLIGYGIFATEELADILGIDKKNVIILYKLKLRYRINRVIACSNKEYLFAKWDPECYDADFLQESRKNNLWYLGNKISFTPKYVKRKLKSRKNFSNEIFYTYRVYLENSDYIFEIDIPYAHKTFYKDMSDFCNRCETK